MGRIGPDTLELLRPKRAVKSSDPVSIVCNFNGELLYLEFTGPPGGPHSISVSKGFTSQLGCSYWSLGTKPAGSPSTEMPYNQPLYVDNWDETTQYHLRVGSESRGVGKFSIELTTDDRIDASVFFFETDEVKRFTGLDNKTLLDDKICFEEKVRMKSVFAGFTSYLGVTTGADGEYRVAMFEEPDVAGTQCLWHFMHGNDSLPSGLRNVHFDPSQFPPPHW